MRKFTISVAAVAALSTTTVFAQPVRTLGDYQSYEPAAPVQPVPQARPVARVQPASTQWQADRPPTTEEYQRLRAAAYNRPDFAPPAEQPAPAYEQQPTRQMSPEEAYLAGQQAVLKQQRDMQREQNRHEERMQTRAIIGGMLAPVMNGVGYRVATAGRNYSYYAGGGYYGGSYGGSNECAYYPRSCGGGTYNGAGAQNTYSMVRPGDGY